MLDWSNTLSLGEQQRLAFGRLLINRPKLVVLDESTSALDVVAEEKMYKLLMDISSSSDTTKGGGLTFVSVGHRPTLLAHHDIKLSLREGAGYITEIPPSAQQGLVDEGFIQSDYYPSSPSSLNRPYHAKYIIYNIYYINGYII